MLLEGIPQFALADTEQNFNELLLRTLLAARQRQDFALR